MWSNTRSKRYTSFRGESDVMVQKLSPLHRHVSEGLGPNPGSTLFVHAIGDVPGRGVDLTGKTFPVGIGGRGEPSHGYGCTPPVILLHIVASACLRRNDRSNSDEVKLAIDPSDLLVLVTVGEPFTPTYVVCSR